MVVHPEVGKWLIALGEKAFGMDPFGWRIAAAVVGSLMVLVMCRFVRRVTGSTALGLVGGLLLALDGLHLVLSRLALLDIFLAFFILLRGPLRRRGPTWFRARLATGADRGAAVPAVAAGRPASPSASPSAPSGRRSSRSPPSACWLSAWNAGARRVLRAPAARCCSGAARRRPPAFVHLVLVALVVYVATWTGWLVHAERVRGATLSNTQYTTLRRRQGVGRPPAEPDAEGARRGHRSRCARCGTTTRTSTPSTPTSSTTATARLRLQAGGLAAA